MRTYENLVELARICVRQNWLSSTPDVAGELWRMAKEYQARAAEHDSAAELEIGDPPPWAKPSTEQLGPTDFGQPRSLGRGHATSTRVKVSLTNAALSRR